jgi:intracellular sulfur oxidation DsrE/DsrF family protein
MVGAVIHVSDADPERHRTVLRNVRNLREDMPGLPIEVVLHGEAVALAVQGLSSLPDEVGALQQQGVVLAVCQNTLRQKKIAESSLLPGMMLVPSGQGELVRKQLEGYAYVKP